MPPQSESPSDEQLPPKPLPIKPSFRSSSIPNALISAISAGEWPQAISRAKLCPGECSEFVSVTIRDCQVRLLPLHYACTIRPPKELIMALLEADPETAGYADRNGRLALHWACDANGACVEVIEMLLLAYPDGAKTIEETFGFLPLHIACYSDSNASDLKYEEEKERIVRKLISNFPEGATFGDSRGWLPLHVACRTGASDKIVSDLLDAYPLGGESEDGDRRLPVHLASCCRTQSNVGVVRSLLRVNPDGIQKKENRHGFLPLHVACSTTTPWQNNLVNCLLDAYPGGGNIYDGNGSLPIHIACRAGASREVISSILHVFPDGAHYTDASRRLPLHWACHINAPKGIIQSLLDAHPKGAESSESKYGYLPLHVACLRGADEDVTQLLLTAYPDATKVIDANGNLPIHIACASPNIPGSVVYMLVHAFPTSVNTLSGNGRTPLSIAKNALHRNERVIRALRMMGKINMPLNTISGNIEQIYTPTPVSCDSDSVSTTSQKGTNNHSPKNRLNCHTKLPANLKDEKEYREIPVSPRRSRTKRRTLPESAVMCVICLEKPANYILYPCGHPCLCDSCKKKNRLAKLNHICPVGRCTFQDAIKVYGNIVGTP